MDATPASVNVKTGNGRIRGTRDEIGAIDVAISDTDPDRYRHPLDRQL